jgi:predicted acylesterase/phospholipase RssA
MFCGTSTGAIIALSLAHGLTATQICDLYRSFGPQVFWNPIRPIRFLRLIRGILCSRYTNGALRKALEDTFEDATLGSIMSKGKFVVVPAFSLTRGKSTIFKTDHAPGLTRDNGRRIVDVAMASAAAPVYLPAVEVPVNNSSHPEIFCDGGVVANHPALVGFVEALSVLKATPEHLRLLSVSTPRPDLAETNDSVIHPRRWTTHRGLVAWGTRPIDIMLNAGGDLTHELIRRLFESQGIAGHYERVHFEKPSCADMDIADKASTAALEAKGRQKGEDGDVRQRLMQFFEPRRA